MGAGSWRRPCPGVAGGGAEHTPVQELSADLHGVASPFRATGYSRSLPARNVGRNGARHTLADPAQCVRSGERCEVGGRRRPGGHHCGLGQQQHERHGHHHHHSEPGGENCSGAPLTGMSRMAMFRMPWFRMIRCRDSRFRSPGHAHEAAASGLCSLAGPGHVSDGRRIADSAVSPRARARADNVHGTIDPTGPETLPETVTLSHSPSAATEDDAEAPASCRTIPSTAPASSPRASALAPALAASSSRNWVIPAAEPASRRARSKRTAGSATANSAVTAPRSFPGRRNPHPRHPGHLPSGPRSSFIPAARGRTSGVMATPAPSGSGSAGIPGLHRCEG